LSEEAQHAIEERYELLHLLGHGGMGLVYKARDRVSGDVIALKVINPGIASSSHVIERSKAELRLARKITHKNVCRVYDLSQFGNIHALSMEYVEGETLRQILRRNETLSLRHGLKLIRQVIDALDEAHRQEVVHRDLKPSLANCYFACVWRLATRAHFYRSSRCESVMSSTFGTHL
jgi:eukaryotic-like serine/threonine-protein kinase